MDLEALDSIIRRLDVQHTMLGRQIEGLYRNPNFDEFEIQKLKKEKLKVKDELSRLYKQRYDIIHSVDI